MPISGAFSFEAPKHDVPFRETLEKAFRFAQALTAPYGERTPDLNRFGDELTWRWLRVLPAQRNSLRTLRCDACCFFEYKRALNSSHPGIGLMQLIDWSDATHCFVFLALLQGGAGTKMALAA